MGSFRLTAGTWHLHHGYNFTGSLVETVLQSLRHSCRSELTRQGTSLRFVTRTTRECVGLGLGVSANLCMSPCSSDYIFSHTDTVSIHVHRANAMSMDARKTVWRVVSEDPNPQCENHTENWFPADCLHRTHYHRNRKPLDKRLR